MSQLPEEPLFEGVYQLEKTDLVLGGADGPSNIQAKQLANRTHWLKQQIDSLGQCTHIGAGISLDTITESGFYCHNGHQLNAPSTEAGYFIVNTQGKNKYGTQMSVTVFDNPRIFIRSCFRNKWGPWKNLSDCNNLENTSTIATPVGSVISFAGNKAPKGWLECNGTLVSRSQYQGLFAAIGSIYGAGDGVSTFHLPDLRGEFIRGFDQGRGVDKQRVFGSWQKGTLNIIDPTANSVGLSNPIHGDNDKNTTNSDVGADDIDLDNYSQIKRAYIAAGMRELDSYGWEEGLGSTRPRNIAMLYCIKY